MLFAAVLAGLTGVSAVHGAPSPSPYARWSRGPSTNADFFPIGVWVQNPANASRYREAGFNTYIGLWKGPTEAQLEELKKAGMRLISEMNSVAVEHLDDPTIIGWMHSDEPDNAQSLEAGLGWGAPVSPATVVSNYQRLRSRDPSRPVMINLGQGVAWDGWHGRGPRTNHPEDYPQYMAGCDIASFDIYPVVHDSAEVAGKLWYVGRGVERLVQWGNGEKIVWNCLECTRISNEKVKPTPQQVRSEAWMALIHGSRGLIYFVHQFKPVFREPALLDDPEMLEGVTALNRQIAQLAPVLNSPTVADRVNVTSSDSSVPITAMLKEHDGALWLFAVAMRDGTTTATFTLQGLEGDKTVEVLDEKRSLPLSKGSFQDRFGSWEVHLYRIAP